MAKKTGEALIRKAWKRFEKRRRWKKKDHVTFNQFLELFAGRQSFDDIGLQVDLSPPTISKIFYAYFSELFPNRGSDHAAKAQKSKQKSKLWWKEIGSQLAISQAKDNSPIYSQRSVWARQRCPKCHQMQDQVIFEDDDDLCRCICRICKQKQDCPGTRPRPAIDNGNGKRRLLPDGIVGKRIWANPID